MARPAAKQPRGFLGWLQGPTVRRETLEGREVYAVVDVVAGVAGTERPEAFWAHLKKQEPGLEGVCDRVEGAGGEAVEMADLAGVLRVVQSLHSAKAERIKRWLVEQALQRLHEQEDPELALLRARQAYEKLGQARPWIDQRMRSISARQALTREWYKRGATEGEQFRQLTNALMEAAFGMDVEGLRQFKQVQGSGGNLRDQMTELELALTALAETAALVLHRSQRSEGVEALERDARSAGKIVAQTRGAIESASGRAVLQGGRRRNPEEKGNAGGSKRERGERRAKGREQRGAMEAQEGQK